MITRDLVQGFIDGYKVSGGDMDALSTAVTNWLMTHPSYPQDEATAKKIASDLGSYRT